MTKAYSKPLILITGASAGLGLALSKELIKTKKYRLMLTARRQSLHRFSLNGIFESDDIYIRALDVTNRNERIAIVSECESKLDGLDILINNAGIATRCVVEDASAYDKISQLEVNYVAPMRLIGLALPAMRKRQMGKIINISSAAGLVGMPTMACYCGSKFALEGATEALWYEVKPWNIRVTSVIPGFIRSNSFLNTQTTKLSGEAMRSEGRDPYFLHYINMEKLISFAMKSAFATPESVSRKIVALIESKNPPLRLPVTLDAWILFLFRRFLPRALYHWIMFQALPKSRAWGKIDSKKVSNRFN